nr:hypothetical protein [Candidatus Omnitrophota bacterium]
MLYAKVVLGLPMDLAFDYSLPFSLQKKINLGSRVFVNFRNRRSVGYVVGLSKSSGVKNVKDVLSLIDEKPVLNKTMFLLAKRISEYYASSLGEAIETMLPEELRKGKMVKGGYLPQPNLPVDKSAIPFLLHDLSPRRRWEVYIGETKKALASKRSVIILFSDIPAVLRAKPLFEAALGREVYLSYRKQPKELLSWENIRSDSAAVVLGTRSAVFAPVNNLGLVILDREEDSVYKQEHVPHYH